MLPFGKLVKKKIKLVKLYPLSGITLPHKNQTKKPIQLNTMMVVGLALVADKKTFQLELLVGDATVKYDSFLHYTTT